MRIVAVTIAVVTLLLATTACRGATDVDGSSSSATSPATASPAQSPTEQAPVSEDGEPPTTMTAAQICASLTPQDMAPLTSGTVTDKPQPTMNLGLPGCKWPVENGYGWLAIDVFKPVSVDAVLTTAVSQYKVGDGTGYQQFDDDGTTMCQALVRTPRTPDGYLLGVKIDGAGDGSANLCTKSVPQTEKVLEALKW